MFPGSQVPTTEDQERAREKAVERYAFRWHASAYVAVNALLVSVWYATGAGFPWFVFSLGGWGIGLAAHLSSAYGNSGDDWVERETQDILREQQKRTGASGEA
jgi:hypothetical protein